MTPPPDYDDACSGCFLRERTGGVCPMVRDDGLAAAERQRQAAVLRGLVLAEASGAPSLIELVRQEVERRRHVLSARSLPALPAISAPSIPATPERKAMSSDLVPFNDPPDRLSRQVAKEARRVKESNALEVYRYELGAGAKAQMAEADVWAAHDAAQAALESELSLLHDGLSKAAGSAAGTELVARWVNHLTNSDHRRFSRQFGG